MKNKDYIINLIISLLLFSFINLTPVHASEPVINVKSIYFKNEPIQYIPNRVYLVISSTSDYKGEITVTYNFQGTVQYLFKKYPVTIIANKDAGLFTDVTFSTSGDIPVTLTLSNSTGIKQQELKVLSDTDRDTIPNIRDDDNDNDTIPDKIELNQGTNPFNADSDFDGILDNVDIFPNDAKETFDSDGDGIGDNTDLDDDNDGLTDSEEAKNGTDPKKKDTDGDGLSDFEEIMERKTDPLNADTDNDGKSDSDDPAPLDPTIKEDSDSDGISDSDEVKYGLDPFDESDAIADNDGDGITNFDEIIKYKTDPNSKDTDNDSLPDGYEIENSLDPLNTSDAELDPDYDGVTTKMEYKLHFDPNSSESIKNIKDSTLRNTFYISPIVLLLLIVWGIRKRKDKSAIMRHEI